ncbi:MAG: proton-conducting transporter membrane subunit [Rhodanobacteraceae bacterium]
MTPFAIVFTLFAASIVAAFGLPRRTAVASAGSLLIAACGLMAWIAVVNVAGGASRPLIELALPVIGAFGFELAPLGALFVLVTVAVFAVALPFQLRDSTDWPRARRGAFVAFIALTLATMIGLFTAASIVAFIVAWEIAALGIWALVGFETRKAAPTAAGLLTMALSETGSLAGLVGLLLLAVAAHDPRVDAIAAAAATLPSGIVTTACVLTFFGFGMKAGVIPLNLWLPPAHGAAPRSISPILSAATLNLGLYAFLRIDSPLARTDPRLGLMILAVGAATALTGIMYALVERDLKRLLAQSSIENMGMATAGFGAGFAFAALGHPLLGGLSLIAGLYHMLNHSAYKALLFLGAGGIDAATGTHDLDRMGGLLKRLPWLGSLFVIGTFAIAGLPPLNGFVSEWMLLQSLLRIVEVASVPSRIVFALAGAALALTAGLAVTCFAMITSSALLGQPRSRAAVDARPAPRSVWVPMGLLALACFGLALWATGVIPVLGRVGAALVGANATAELVPSFFGHASALATGVVDSLTQLGAQLGRGILPLRGLIVMYADTADGPVAYAMSTALTFAVLGCMLLITWILSRVLRRRRNRVARQIPWNGGIPHLRPEMAYTATTFSAPARVLFNAVFDPEVARQEQHQGAFLTARQHREVRLQLVDRVLVRPLGDAAQRLARELAALHHGKVTAYAGYVLASLIVVMLITRILYLS